MMQSLLSCFIPNSSNVLSHCVCVSRPVMSDSVRPHGVEPTRLLCPWNSPGKNTGVGSHSFLQGIFLTQELSLGFLHCRQILYHLSLIDPLKIPVWGYLWWPCFIPGENEAQRDGGNRVRIQTQVACLLLSPCFGTHLLWCFAGKHCIGFQFQITTNLKFLF